MNYFKYCLAITLVLSINVGVFASLADAAAAAEQKVLAKDIPALFQSVYGRTPSDSEKKYWVGRLKDKPGFDQITGAMAFQKSRGKSPKVLGAKSNALFEMHFDDYVIESAPGELVTYHVKMINRDPEGRELTPSVFVNSPGLEIPFVSDNGRRKTVLANGRLGGGVNWNESNSNRAKIPIHHKKSHTFTFKIKTPNTIGEQYCVKVNSAIFLKDEDCNKIVKQSKKAATPSPVAKPAAKPTLKTTDKDFRILGPDSLSTDKGDQGITWHASAAVQRAYPKVKIELCPGKDFKGCIILDAVVDNDNYHLINMPPVPRIGKWYLRLIGRNQSGGIVPSASIIRLITLQQ